MNETKFNNELETENHNHIQVFFYRAPKKNYDAIVQNLKKFIPWFKEQGVRIEYYQFSDNETMNNETMERMESIAKTISTSEDEDLWIELQYYRDRKHCEDIFAKMMQEKSFESLGNEFFGLITDKKSLVTGGFNILKT